MRSSAAGKFFHNDWTDAPDASLDDAALNAAPNCAVSSAIWSAVRVVVPCVSMALMNDASPGFSWGFASPPVLTTSVAETTGIVVPGANRTVRPFGRVNDVAVGRVTGRSGPGRGAWARHGASVLTASSPVPGATFGGGGVGTAGPRSGSPGTP